MARVQGHPDCGQKAAGGCSQLTKTHRTNLKNRFATTRLFKKNGQRNRKRSPRLWSDRQQLSDARKALKNLLDSLNKVHQANSGLQQQLKRERQEKTTSKPTTGCTKNIIYCLNR